MTFAVATRGVLLAAAEWTFHLVAAVSFVKGGQDQGMTCEEPPETLQVGVGAAPSVAVAAAGVAEGTGAAERGGGGALTEASSPGSEADSQAELRIKQIDGMMHRAALLVERLHPGERVAEEARHLEQDYEHVDVNEGIDVLAAAFEAQTVEDAKFNGDLLTDDLVEQIEDTLVIPRTEDGDCGGHPELCVDGDILVDSAEERQALLQGGSAIGSSRRREQWPATDQHVTINYCFASDVAETTKHMFRVAAKQVHHAVICFNFVEVGNTRRLNSYHSIDDLSCDNSENAIFVRSHPEEGCFSYLGFGQTLKAQALQLENPGCMVLGTVIHEIGHALGMAHEHKRPDRDEHVTIKWDHITDGKEDQFTIDESHFEGNSVQYDYMSVMHYGKYYFAKDLSKPTIVTKDGMHDHLIGQEVGLTQLDANTLAEMYKEISGICQAQDLERLPGCIDKDPELCASKQCDTEEQKDSCCECYGGMHHHCWKWRDCRRPGPQPTSAPTPAPTNLDDTTTGKGR